MKGTNESDWVLPAALPLDKLKGRDLEECVYWLLDAMGAQELEWRLGGTGEGTGDQGRDLAALFYSPGADGETEPQSWWIECKGRSRTVEPNAVKAAVNNALAMSDLDYLLVATNSTFSNPTRDWVKQWQAAHPRPKIKLWDRSSIERQLARHPEVVLRLFSQALSTEGRLKAIEQRFWKKFEYSSATALAEIWPRREDIEVGGMALIALIVNEFAHGDIIRRPWGAAIREEGLLLTLSLGLRNVPYLAMRSDVSGESQKPFIRAIAYLMLVAVEYLKPEKLASLVKASIDQIGDQLMPVEVQEFLLMPILDQLMSELQEACSHDCDRIVSMGSTTFSQGNAELESYWKRLIPSGEKAEDASRMVIRMENTKAACKVGFVLARKLDVLSIQ